MGWVCDQGMFVRNVPYPYKREINKPVFIKYLKSFNIGTVTPSTNELNRQ